MIISLTFVILALVTALVWQDREHRGERRRLFGQMIEERLRMDADQKTMIETMLRNKDIPIAFDRTPAVLPASPGWFDKKPNPPILRTGVPL